MNKEEIALQLTLKTLEASHNYIGVSGLPKPETVDVNTDNIARFYNRLIEKLNINPDPPVQDPNNQ